LGVSLDRLSAKVKDPDQLEAALSGVKQFNKQPNFYTGYAKNFIMKSVKKGSDSDPRVGYIRQVN
jgi:carbon monoxide dehydrogenase subunit G